MRRPPGRREVDLFFATYAPAATGGVRAVLTVGTQDP